MHVEFGRREEIQRGTDAIIIDYRCTRSGWFWLTKILFLGLFVSIFFKAPTRSVIHWKPKFRVQVHLHYVLTTDATTIFDE